MSQEKIREILSDFWCERMTGDTALAEINKIVMECVPEAAIAFNSDNDYLVGKKRGYNEAIAEFKANWEGE